VVSSTSPTAQEAAGHVHRHAEPFEIRPWVQIGIVISGAVLCVKIGGNAGVLLGCVLLALLPASIAVLGVGEPFYQAREPGDAVPAGARTRAVLPAHPGLDPAVYRLPAAAARVSMSGESLLACRGIACEISFFGLIGGCLYIRRHQLGIEPSRSPERDRAREEAERVKLRARMLDDVFQQARIGKFVEATRPLAKLVERARLGEPWRATRHFVAAQALAWQIAGGPEHHRQHAHPPPAARGPARGGAGGFERLREQAPTLTLDSPTTCAR
jgi:hypothetical protein